jgi:hypothetical protein
MTGHENVIVCHIFQPKLFRRKKNFFFKAARLGLLLPIRRQLIATK